MSTSPTHPIKNFLTDLFRSTCVCCGRDFDRPKGERSDLWPMCFTCEPSPGVPSHFNDESKEWHLVEGGDYQATPESKRKFP